ncbi:heparan-alpha-glucosaminide N-acetyltransferase domain-containing protein [Arenibacter palladensis]|uniref:DUF1624 domain-containing protein n=1 Tax=Arenibacter palladensis TaxID=237373 RepID=UPI002FD19282
MKPKTNRIESIDILRGLVMVLMALDHVRDYFNYGSFFIDPTDVETTTPILFFTRFITHYCAPVFVFLAGTSAFLYGRNKTKSQLSKFLLTRGIWLIFMEVVVNNLIWTFDLSYSFPILQVIWAIGFSMICLSFLIYLPYKWILVLGLVIIAGHNLLDGLVMQGNSPEAIMWYLLHQNHIMVLGPDKMILFHYPVIPWIGLMALGYCLGQLYVKDFNEKIRRTWLLRMGLGALALFFLIRGLNVYGDLVPWTVRDSSSKTVISFFNVTKYPPSLAFVLITIGPALLFLYTIENVKNSITNFFLIFGRVPFFYYFLHVLVIHTTAIIGIIIFGGNWKDMILTADVFMNETLVTYGYPLWITYMVWIGIIFALYPLCEKYMIYKINNKDKWWLSYL